MMRYCYVCGTAVPGYSPRVRRVKVCLGCQHHFPPLPQPPVQQVLAPILGSEEPTKPTKTLDSVNYDDIQF